MVFGWPLRTLSRGSGISEEALIISPWSLISHPRRGSTASAPKSTSTAVIAFSESEACRLEERSSQIPAGRDSHRLCA